MTMMRFTVLVMSVLTLFTSAVRGQSSEPTWVVKGCLVDRTNDDPLMYAKVSALGTTDTTVTDAVGCFALSLHFDPSKECHYILVEYNGFERYAARIKRKDLNRVRVHRIKPRKFGPYVAEAKIKSLEERLAVLK